MSNLSRFSNLDAVLLSIICAAALCISTALIANAAFDPVLDAEEAMTRLAKEFYIEHLYPNTLGFANISNPAPVLSATTEYGLPPVRLRQLLLYKDSAKSEYQHYFSNSYYKCDTNKTTLRFYPIEPYGPLDYQLKIDYACEDLRNTAD